MDCVKSCARLGERYVFLLGKSLFRLRFPRSITQFFVSWLRGGKADKQVFFTAFHHHFSLYAYVYVPLRREIADTAYLFGYALVL